MTEEEIEWLRGLIAAKTPLVWRDVDGGMHPVRGFASNYKEEWEESGEPVAAIQGNKVVALRNTEASCFFIVTPALAAAPASAAEPVAMWQRQPVNTEHWLEVEEAHISFYRERGQKIRALCVRPDITSDTQ